MKLLVLGNSHAASLKIAYESDPALVPGWDVSFFVTPGGTGPYFTLEGSRLIPVQVHPKLPPYYAPDTTPQTPLDAYDAVLVCALGYVDGGDAFVNAASQQGLLHEFGPRCAGRGYSMPLVSKPCYEAAVSNLLAEQSGIALMDDLRAVFPGPVLIQRFPHLSDEIKSRGKWGLRTLYRNPVGMYRFLVECRDAFLMRLGARLNLRILPLPDFGETDIFTPAHLMTADCIHSAPEYSRLVWSTVAEELGRLDLETAEAGMAGGT